MAELLAKDYVVQSIDTGKQTNARAVVERVRGSDGGGIPWMVVLDGEGKRVITSEGPEGNIGCPYHPNEIAFFRTMLERSSKRLTKENLDAIQRANEAYVEKLKEDARKAKEARESAEHRRQRQVGR